ncbi:phytoene/squalene synthase family protein [Microbacterium allomyrinae]|uniref:Squalene/phytoene synthase family protein n=1 Tax=Microbacterium allomyrinae TaxID=2830666 RepID=A0A9X1LYY2_9MICO|nr:squalene/phytoene synthase family protein [Microbacterium allomyrinae]MCC2034178.1 squalene/phytoene synthase family protein [Microbacterium allomyrinae]
MTGAEARPPAASLALYDRTARDAAATVIANYSTSFALACRLLGVRTRPHVRSVYALVRVADEVVDGPAAAAGLPIPEAAAVLDGLERETLASIDRGFSANLIVHAFALTARECGIGADLVGPFFTAMRTDLSIRAHDGDSHDEYVYGSAEVVGLMCLRVFLNAGEADPVDPPPALADGARRLGAAFQDVNFLRDLDHDGSVLGRDYLGLESGSVSRDDVLARIDRDLAAAAEVIPSLPADCRRAVTAAHDLFAELSVRLRADPGTAGRVRVPDTVKARLAARAWLGFAPREVRA